MTQLGNPNAHAQELKRRGTLPESLSSQPPKAKPPRALSIMATGVTHTCPLAFSLSAQLRRVVGAPPNDAAEVAQLLAAEVQASCGRACPAVEAAGGHLNFFGGGAGLLGGSSATSPRPLPPPDQATSRDTAGEIVFCRSVAVLLDSTCVWHFMVMHENQYTGSL